MDYECRTTVHRALTRPEQLAALAVDLAARGVTRFVVHLARSDGCLDPRLRETAGGWPPPQALWEQLAGLFPVFAVRGP